MTAVDLMPLDTADDPPAARHTPGPWGHNIPPASQYPVVFAGRNTHVAAVCSKGLSEAEVAANRRLIASAPDLLAACKRAAAATDRGSALGAALAAVIAKAEGRS